MHLSMLNEMCASVSTPSLEKLHLSFSTWRENCPELSAALAKLRDVDTTLSSARFSNLSEVSFRFNFDIPLGVKPTTFSDLIGPEPASDRAAITPTSHFRRSGTLPSIAFEKDEGGTLRLIPSWLAEFLRVKAEGELPHLHHRGIVTTKTSVILASHAKRYVKFRYA